jgi:hypothetical protein
MDDSPNKMTHAQRRRSEARDAVREKLQAIQYLRRLEEIADQAEQVDASKVPALRLKADIYTRLLAKCLPDLKAVEHSGEIRERRVAEMTDDELLAIVAAAGNSTVQSADEPGTSATS